MKKKTGRYLLYLFAGASFLVAVLEGFIYYSKYDNTPFFELILVLQNGIKAFLFSPDLSAQNVMETLQGQTDAWQYLIGCLYVVAVFAAPLCTATALLHTVALLLKRGVRLTFGTRKIDIVYGWNPSMEHVLKKDFKERPPVGLVTEETVPDQRQFELTRCNVFLCRAQQEMKLRRRASHFFLLEKSSAKNFSHYVALQRWWENNARGEAPKVTCACEEEGIRSLIIAFHDECSGRNKSIGALPVNLFSMAELQARAVWDVCPICEYNFSDSFPEKEDRYHVHMLLVGLGSIGRQLLRQAVSLSVLSSSGRVCFDVIDRSAEERMRFFKGCFSDRYVQVDDQAGTITIPSDRADGLLTIRFHSFDVDDGDFTPLLRGLNEEDPFTYAAICLRNSDAAIRCLDQLSRILQENERPIPIALRVESNQELSEYFRERNPFYGRVFPICCDQDGLSLKGLANEEAYDGAVQFNHKYNHWSAMLSGDDVSAVSPEEEWRALPFFKQDSSLNQFLHQKVKDQRLSYEKKREVPFSLDSEPTEEEIALLGSPRLEEPLAVEFARMEHRRWCYYMAVNGWRYGEKKNEAQKINPCMVPWETLRQSGQSYTCIYDTTPYRMLTQREKEEKSV